MDHSSDQPGQAIERSVREREYLFIIGAARSGTTWLHRMLSAHPQVASLQDTELTIFTRYLAQPVAQFRKEKAEQEAGSWSLGLGALWTEDRFFEEVRCFLDNVYGSVLATNPRATHILDKHPNYARQLPLIADLLPNARFIHLIRDGREVVVSALSVNKRVGHSAGELAQASRDWRDFVGAARRDGRMLGNRYMEVRYEELKNGSPEVLGRIFAHCGLPADTDMVARIHSENHISRKQYSSGDASLNTLRVKPDSIWKERLSLTDRYRMHRWAGALLMELGYAGSDWWASSPTDRMWVRFRSFLWRIGRGFQGGVQSWKLASVDPFEPLRAWRRS
ncbi:MAG: sulfotransferase [Flavobacteriales bacterium]|nr:sulfotransferase [Flavobacteriales bacterium]MCB9180490.1 sulfotransferase [Flavobacteriales bacterium]MCB9198867.1 sulfotransferase [Flavobacteriales bacterium]